MKPLLNNLEMQNEGIKSNNPQILQNDFNCFINKKNTLCSYVIPGMRGTTKNQGLIQYYTDQPTTLQGETPLGFHWDHETHVFQCDYVPPVYGVYQCVK